MLRRAVPYVLAIALIAIGFTQLNRYNVTWDEALGDLFFGQRYLSYLTTFDAHYLDFDHDPYPPGHVPNLFSSAFGNKPWEYWPAADILADGTSRVVSNWLHLVDPFDGFHSFNLFAGAALLFVLYRIVEKQTSTATAVAASMMLFLMPRVVCDLMANIKDFPEMVFYSLTVLAFFVAYERASAAGIVGAGALWGIALGTKANSWFLPAVIVLYIVLRGLGPWRGRDRRLFLSIVGAGVLAGGVMLALWPYLWPEPLTRFFYNFNYVTERAGSTGSSTISPWFALWATTPPLVIALFFAGAFVVVRRAIRREPFSVFLVVWFGVIAGRLPFSANFDGVRHFLEIFVPVAVIAAIGTVGIAAWIASRVGPAARKAAFATVVAIPIATTAFATVASHPFEIAYWNAFVGGLRGAQERQIPQSCDYWGASYRLGIDWMNRNAPRGSILVVPIAGHAVRLVAPLRLRPDIRLVDYPIGGGPTASEQRLRETKKVSTRIPLFVMFVPRREWATELDIDCMRRLPPTRAWTLDNAPVLLIYRYRP